MGAAVKRRLEAVDSLRGLAILSMILYHGVWDLVTLCEVELRWYRGLPGILWQQSICWSFIFLAGFSWQLGRAPWKRGLLTLGAGAAVSLITALAGHPVRFGILTLLGSCMLLWLPLSKIRLSPAWGLGLCGVLFGVTGGIMGLRHLGAPVFRAPDWLRADWALAYLGFPQPGFSSSDYFPLLPWIFLFGVGYFTFSLLKSRDLRWLERGRVPVVSTLGRNSLLIYLLHQPILYGLCILGVWLAGR